MRSERTQIQLSGGASGLDIRHENRPMHSLTSRCAIHQACFRADVRSGKEEFYRSSSYGSSPLCNLTWQLSNPSVFHCLFLCFLPFRFSEKIKTYTTSIPTHQQTQRGERRHCRVTGIEWDNELEESIPSLAFHIYDICFQCQLDWLVDC